MENRYYKIMDGEGWDIIEKWHSEVHAAYAQIAEIAVRYGADVDKHVMIGTKVEGLLFKEPPDAKLWNPIAAARGYYRPNKRGKAGKEIEKALSAIKMPSGQDLAVRLGCKPFFQMAGRHYCTDLGYKKVGQHYYVEAPFFASPPVKPGMEIIPRAQFFLMTDP